MGRRQKRFGAEALGGKAVQMELLSKGWDTFPSVDREGDERTNGGGSTRLEEGGSLGCVEGLGMRKAREKPQLRKDSEYRAREPLELIDADIARPSQTNGNSGRQRLQPDGHRILHPKNRGPYHSWRRVPPGWSL